jgi:hypothetical protein
VIKRGGFAPSETPVGMVGRINGVSSRFREGGRVGIDIYEGMGVRGRASKIDQDLKKTSIRPFPLQESPQRGTSFGKLEGKAKLQ